MCVFTDNCTSSWERVYSTMDPSDPRFRDQFGRLNVDAPSFIPNPHAQPFVPYPPQVYGESVWYMFSTVRVRCRYKTGWLGTVPE